MIGLLVGSSATYYILITYMPTYISQFMGTSFSSAFVVNTSVIAINLLLCPIVGLLIDKVGRRKCLIIGCLGFLILSYPVFYVLIQQTNGQTSLFAAAAAQKNTTTAGKFVKEV